MPVGNAIGDGAVHRIAIRYIGIALKNRTAVGFVAGQRHNLAAAEGKDIVPHRIIRAIVLVEAIGLTAVNHILLHRNIGRSLIGIDAPAAIVGAAHIVDMIFHQ